jgi:hypothetical protein
MAFILAKSLVVHVGEPDLDCECAAAVARARVVAHRARTQLSRLVKISAEKVVELRKLLLLLDRNQPLS